MTHNELLSEIDKAREHIKRSHRVEIVLCIIMWASALLLCLLLTRP